MLAAAVLAGPTTTPTRPAEPPTRPTAVAGLIPPFASGPAPIARATLDRHAWEPAVCRGRRWGVRGRSGTWHFGPDLGPLMARVKRIDGD